MCVGQLIICNKLDWNTRSHNWVEKLVNPDKVAQFTSGTLKSSIRTSGVGSAVKFLRYVIKVYVYSVLAFGELYNRQILIGLLRPTCTRISSRSSGHATSQLERKLLMARSTPPPLVFLSER